MNRIGDPAADSSDPGALIVAVDVLGGRFAVNGGALVGELGEVCYFGPDTLRWEPIGGGYSAFIVWAIGSGLGEFYTEMRWPGWDEEVRRLSLDQGLSTYPPLWSAEGRTDIATTSRRPCPITELIALHADMAEQLGP
ncbi:hypothetical protein JMUB6875_41930 [Nocardia sp. JMUB6875]